MNIIYVSQFDFRGPGEKYWFYLANELTSRGHQVLFFIYGSPESTKILPKQPLFRIEPYNFRFGGGIPRKLERIYTDFRPDIIHCLNPRYRLLFFSDKVQQATKAKLIVHQEDNEELLLHKWKTWRQYRYKFLIGNMIKKWLPGKWPIYDPELFKSILPYIAGMDCLGPIIEERINQQFPKIKTASIFFAVDLDYYKPSANPINRANDKFIIHYGGTITPHIYADFLMLLKAVSLCRQRGLKNLKLIQTGGQLDKVKPVLDSDLKDLQLSDIVELKQFLSTDEYKKELNRTDIAVQPGKNDEVNRYRLPSKMFTYMAMGKPTITFAVGVGELLSDKEVVKTYSNSPEEFAEKIMLLYKDENLRKSLSDSIRRKAEDWFSLGKVADQHLEFYQRALENKR